MDNKNKSQTGNKNNNSCNNNLGKDKGLGLASFSYADFILLSSTISYALAEELNDADLALLIVFLGMVSADLALLTTQDKIKAALGSQQIEEDIVGEEEAEEGGLIGSTIVIPTVGRNSKTKKRKRIKRIKKVKKK
ncbi:hypothetical protein [Clostridium sp. CCUG 7971]|uniref:hypothetical protein n=1 Tax=Clostridium sp. CCUG 7971 TaxID=2811414 RepID=UPI001ABABDBD|nr:hypothetical protein [Clostridium sp. CCUG 7971]MBO3446229.1 hypothetical protein [Clostridium sp. CCUG 7971]